MKNKSSRKKRKVFLLFVVVFITAITLVVETYAWFVGLSTVETNSFSIAISSVDGLELSLNGQYWTSGSTPLLIKDNNHTYITETGCSNANCAYSGHKNMWPTSLVPVSSYGNLTKDNGSKLYIFEKNSLTTNPGGYYVYSDLVGNSASEVDKYVAFDLFIRNGKGSSYNGTYNMSEEEDIYLSADSFATTVVSGSRPDYGAANSVRVGLFEIARVGSSGYTVSNITGSTCASATTGVTPLCVGSSNMIKTGTTLYSRDELQYNTWNIWEPNHASHSTQLVNYFNQSCKKRTGDHNNSTYTGPCQPIDSGSSKKTYSFFAAANNGAYVNIYDGPDVNEYRYTMNYAINTVDTYKTSDATAVGSAKTPLLKLAGNSITKVRVYIWLEGQDIDNFDIISKNPSVQVKFGFTKDRYGIEETNNTGRNSRTSTFQDDSWEKIKSNVVAGTTSQYNIGDMKTIRINGNQYRLRLVNKNSPSTPCTDSSNSQSACGFVVEFYDAVTSMKMNNTATNSGGYPATNVYTYLNGDLLNSLPEDLKGVIADTRVVSGHGSSDSSNFTSLNQKLYLLSGKEVYGSDSYDTASGATRQLDYYSGKGVTASTNYLYARKQYNGTYSSWWLRPADSRGSGHFRSIGNGGYLYGSIAGNTGGVSPAFRIA